MKKSLAIVLCILACALFVNAQGSRPGMPFPQGLRLPQRPFPIMPIPTRQPAPLPIAGKKPYWDINRAVNPNGPAHGNPKYTTLQDFRFPVSIADAPLRDGRGHVLGTLAPGAKVQINKGAEKVMVGPDGKRHVYEFVLGAKLNGQPSAPANSAIHASGLVRRSAIRVEDRPALHLQQQPKQVKGPTTAYSLTGGNPKDKDLGYYNPKHEFVPYKFGSGNPPRGYTTPHRESTDNVARPLSVQNSKPKSYVNVLSKLPGKGGTATTVYEVNKSHPVTFQRLKDVPAKTVKLYKPGGTKPQGSMTFIKGYVNDPKTSQKTVGWVAEKAVKPKTASKSEKKHKN
jgi:hypothetical protein